MKLLHKILLDSAYENLMRSVTFNALNRARSIVLEQNNSIDWVIVALENQIHYETTS